MDLFRLISPSNPASIPKGSPLTKAFEGGKLVDSKVNQSSLGKQRSATSAVVAVTRVAPSSPLRNKRKQQQQQQQQQQEQQRRLQLMEAQVDGRLASAARRRQEAEEERRQCLRQRTERRLQLASRRAESLLSDRRRAARRQGVRIQLVRRRRLDVERREADERRRAAERKEWEAYERRRRHLLSRRRRMTTKAAKDRSLREEDDAGNTVVKNTDNSTKDTLSQEPPVGTITETSDDADGCSTQDRLDRARRRRELCEYERRAAVLATLDRRTATASEAVERRLTLQRNRAHRTVQYAQQVARTVRAARRIQRAVRRQQQQPQQSAPPTCGISQNVAATRMQRCVAWRQFVSARALLRDEQLSSNRTRGDGSDAFSFLRAVLSITVSSSSVKAKSRARENKLRTTRETSSREERGASYEEMQRFMMQHKNLQAAGVVLKYLKPSLGGVSKAASLPLDDRAFLSALLIATHPTHVLGEDYQESDKANSTLARMVSQSARAVLDASQFLHQTLTALLETAGMEETVVPTPELTPVCQAIAELIPALVSYATLFATWKRADLNDLLTSMSTSAQQSWSAYLIADKMLRYLNTMTTSTTQASSPSRRLVANDRHNSEESSPSIDVDDGSTGSGYTATSSSSGGTILAEQQLPSKARQSQSENVVVMEDVLFPLRAHHEAAKEGAWKHLARLRLSLNKLVGRDEGYRMIAAAKVVATQRLRRGNDDGLLQQLRSEVDQLWSSTRSSSSSSSSLEIASSSEASFPPTQAEQLQGEQLQEAEIMQRSQQQGTINGVVDQSSGPLRDVDGTTSAKPKEDVAGNSSAYTFVDSSSSSSSRQHEGDGSSVPNVRPAISEEMTDTQERNTVRQVERGDTSPQDSNHALHQDQHSRSIPDSLLSNAELVHSILLTDPSDFHSLTVDGEDSNDKTDHIEEFMEQWTTPSPGTVDDGGNVTATVVAAMEGGSYQAIHELLLDLHRKMRSMVPNRTDLHSHLDDEAVRAARSADAVLRLVTWAAEAMASHLESPIRARSTRHWLEDTAAALSSSRSNENNVRPPPYGFGSWEKFTLASITFLHFKANLCKRDIANVELRAVAPVIHRIGWDYERSRFLERFGLNEDGTVRSLQTGLPATWAWIQKAVESHVSQPNCTEDASSLLSWSSERRLLEIVRKQGFVDNVLFAQDKFALPEIFTMDAWRISWLRDEVRCTVIASSLALHAVNVSRASSSSLRLGNLPLSVEAKRQELRSALRRNAEYKSQQELIAAVSESVAEFAKALQGKDSDGDALTTVKNCASAVLKGEDHVFRLLDKRVRQFFQNVAEKPAEPSATDPSPLGSSDAPSVPEVMRTGRGMALQGGSDNQNNNVNNLAAEKEAVRLGFALFSDDLVRAAKTARQIIGVACKVHGDSVLDPMMRDDLEIRNADNVD